MKPLLLTLIVFSSFLCGAQSTKSDITTAAYLHETFLKNKKTLVKGKITQANIDWLQQYITLAETSINKVLNCKDPGYNEKRDMVIATYLQVNLQDEMGRLLFYDMGRPKEAYERLKKIENSMRIIEDGTHYPLHYKTFDKSYEIKYEITKYYSVMYYRVMAAICNALSYPGEGAEYYKRSLNHRYVTPWYIYLNSYDLIVYKTEKNEVDRELIEYYLINLKSFVQLNRVDSLKIARDSLLSRQHCYDWIKYLLYQHPELSDSGRIYREAGDVFYQSKDYKQAAECYNNALKAGSSYVFCYQAADVACRLNDKEMAMLYIGRIINKAYNLEAKCSLLERIAETYKYFGMASEAKSYEKKIRKCKKVDKREKIKDRNFYRNLNRY
jgi:tetratricopeptide (TPR) repeat protein